MTYKTALRTVLAIVAVCVALGLGIGLAVSATSARTPLAFASGTPGPATTPSTGAAHAGDDATQTNPVTQSQTAAPDAADSQEVEISGTVASVDTARGLFVLTTPQGELPVRTSTQTEFDDGLSSLAGVHTGMGLAVEYVPQADGSLAASKIDGMQKGADTPDAADTPDGHD